MAEDNAAPANGPAREMSTKAFRSGRIDLNCRSEHRRMEKINKNDTYASGS